MNEFRTIVRTQPSPSKIALNHRILTLGSCFSDAIGARLQQNKFAVSTNPFGVIYNPASIHAVVQSAIRNQTPDASRFVQNDDVHLHFDLHSSFSDIDKPRLEESIRDAFAHANEFIRNTSWILITYGTAWVFTHRDTGRIVANCHKQPARSFDKSLLAVDQIVQSFGAMYQDLKTFNPRANIVLTVSPVRHIKDTLQLNSVSKSILRIACHEIGSQFSGVEYFPAYEIMMDDLRDYRFYKSDMIHPTEQAEDYIWNAFTHQYMDSGALDFIQQWRSIYPALTHRPFHPASSGHQIFLRQTLHKLEQLKGVINVHSEIQSIRNQLLDSKNSKETSS
jgi:hypothetical protein